MRANRRIYFATKNQGKWSSVAPVAHEFNIDLVMPEGRAELQEIQHDDVRVVAAHKVRNALHLHGGPIIVHDGGCFCDGLRGFPGAMTRPVMEKIGLDGLLRLLEGKDRRASMHNATAYFDREMYERGLEPVVYYDVVPGTLLEEPQGTVHNLNWSSLFRVFVPDGLNQPFAGLGLGEMQAWRQSREQPSSYTQLFQWLTQEYWIAA